jgi:hypothetical protein
MLICDSIFGFGHTFSENFFSYSPSRFRVLSLDMLPWPVLDVTGVGEEKMTDFYIDFECIMMVVRFFIHM